MRPFSSLFCVPASSLCIARIVIAIGLHLSSVCRADQVVFSEVMFNPSAGKPEFLELWNQTSTPFDIAAWEVSGDIQFRFPPFTPSAPVESFLKPKERILLTSASPDEVRRAYDVPSTVRVFGPWKGSLRNSGGAVRLRDKNGSALTAFQFDDSRLWPVAADGLGHSLILTNVHGDPSNARNWACSQRIGGSPGIPEPEPLAPPPALVGALDLAYTNQVVLTDLQDSWRYFGGTRPVPAGWERDDFDAQEWPEGAGLLGFETATLPSPGIQTPIFSTGRVTYYFRRVVQVPALRETTDVVADLVLDDGAQVFVNGVEVARVRMPAGEVGEETLASNTVSDALLETNLFHIPAKLFQPGTNVIAVAVHQATAGSSDLVFGMRVTAVTPLEPLWKINEYGVGADGKGFIELLNRTGRSQEVGDIFITDDLATPKKIRAALRSTIAEGGVGVLPFARSALGAAPQRLYVMDGEAREVLSAITWVEPSRNGSMGRSPDGGSSFYQWGRSTPGQPNATGTAIALPLRLTEVHRGTSGVDWIEVYNPNTSSVLLDGWKLIDERPDDVPFFPTGVLQGTAYAYLSVTSTAVRQASRVALVSPSGEVVDAVRLRGSGDGSLARFPEKSAEWYWTTNSTPASPNPVLRDNRVVINEILTGAPSGEPGVQFIELVNRTQTPLDLSGWTLSGGVRATLPAGAKIEANGYAVVAADASRLRKIHGLIPIIGEFSGRLNKEGDRLRLEDASGNLVNELEYSFGGDWPAWTSGGGASLELVNPDADNSSPTAWFDSDESGKSNFRSYSATGIYSVLKAMGTAADYKELHLFLTGEGHVVLDKVRLNRFGANTNLLSNPTRMSVTGQGDSGWLAQGTHAQSFVANGQLHVVADDRGDNKVNKLEIDAVDMNRNDLVTLSFDGKWIAGSPRLIAQTWDRSFSASFRLDIPENLGTPGKRNSRYLAHPPAQVSRLSHQPAVPKTGDRIRVTARVTSVDPVVAVTLFHRPDPGKESVTWQSKPMFDDGKTGGDTEAGDGIYTAELTEHAIAGRIVQFRVEATTSGGVVASLPRQGSDKPAMFVVDDRVTPQDLRTERFVISTFDLDAIANGGNQAHGFRYPRLQNHYFNATFISSEEEIFYGVGLRNTGSPWTRSADLGRAKWKLPNDRRFRGRYKYSWDNDAEGHISHNRVTRQLLYWMGQPTSEQEFVQVAINNGSWFMREETEPIDNDYLNRHFSDGSEGDLYRIDDEWWLIDNGQLDYRNADWLYKFTENPGRYRSEYMKRTKETDDDFTALIHLFKVVSGNYTQSQVDRLLNPVDVLTMAAVRGYIADWDFFSMSRGKNAWLYRPPVDGRFRFLHWDSDQAFGDVDKPFQTGVPGYAQWAAQPYNTRRFNALLVELMERYCSGSPRFDAWIQAEEDASTVYTANASFYRNWFERRRAVALAVLGSTYTADLSLSSSTAVPGANGSGTTELRGAAPSGIWEVAVESHPEATFEWLTAKEWRISGLRLPQGDQALVLVGLDRTGTVFRRSQVRVNATALSAPFVSLSPQDDNLRIPVGVGLQLQATGLPSDVASALDFRWSVAPTNHVLVQTNAEGAARLQWGRPGLYQVTVSGVDSRGRSNGVTSAVLVHGPHGSSRFDLTSLEHFWALDGVDYRANTSRSTWLSLQEPAGVLTLACEEDVAHPLTLAAGGCPIVWRAAPQVDGWAFQTEVAVNNGSDAFAEAGTVLEWLESGKLQRISCALSGASEVVVRRLDAVSGSVRLASEGLTQNRVVLRLRRVGSSLLLESNASGVWKTHFTQPMGPASTPIRVGLFLASTEPRRVRYSFFNATLADPSVHSPLAESVDVSEFMPDPPDGDAYEFIELWNRGALAADLSGAQFTNGISYTFPPTQLAPGARLVLARDRSAFAARYGLEGRNLAAGVYGGKLDNAGERLTLIDSGGLVIFDFSYGKGGDLPGETAGQGFSLVHLNMDLPLSDPNAWQASVDYLGSPGAPATTQEPTLVFNEILLQDPANTQPVIELYNVGVAPIDAKTLILTDDIRQPRKFRFTTNQILAPQSFWAFRPSDASAISDAQPLVLDAFKGGELWLFTDSGPGQLVLLAHQTYEPTPSGVTSGRFPDGTGRWWRQLKRPTITDDPSGSGSHTNEVPVSGEVVISRVMYHPLQGEDEFVELWNRSETVVPIGASDASGLGWRLSKAIRFVFATGTRLNPGERLLVVGGDPQSFRVRNRLDPNAMVFGPFAGSLKNNGERLELERPGLSVGTGNATRITPFFQVDEVRFDSPYPWPTSADGQGSLLRRLEFDFPALLPEDWEAAPTGFQADTDQDGIQDVDEKRLGLNPLNPLDAYMDPDQDGLDTRTELALGTDPFDRKSRFLIQSVVAVGQRITLKFQVGPARTYRVFRSDRINGGEWAVVAEVAARPEAAVIEVNGLEPLPGSATFFRVSTP